MAKYAGIDIETPQEVLARLRGLRQQALMKAQTPHQRNLINLERSMDLVFGNPEVRAAEERTGAVKGAMDRANEEMEGQEGLSDNQKQLRKLKAVQGALEKIDPDQALRVGDQIRELEVQELERQKLTQQVGIGKDTLGRLNKRYIFDTKTMQSKEIDISTPEGQAMAEEARAKGHLVAEKEGSLINFFSAAEARKHDRQMKSLTLAAEREKAQLEAKADAQGKLVENLELTPATKNALQKGLPAVAQMMDQLETARDLMTDGRFLDIAGRVKNFSMSVRDFMGTGASAEDVEAYRKMIRVMSNVKNAAGELRHERYGGALTAPELEDSKTFIPDQSDTPTKFVEKINTLYNYFLTGQRRAQGALTTNRWEALLAKKDKLVDPEADRLFTPQFLDTVANMDQSKPTKVPTVPKFSAPEPVTSPDGWSIQEVK